MEINYTVDEINSTVQTTTFLLLPNTPKILLFGYLNWVEVTLALLGLVINSYVIMAVLLGKTRASRGYFFGLLNLSLAQNFISVISISSVTVPLFDPRNNLTSPLVETSWWRPLFQNATVAIFSGVCVTGIAAMSWSHWWQLNIWVNHFQLPSGYRVAKTVTWVLWCAAFLFAVWLNCYHLSKTGLSTTTADDDQRSVQFYARLYSVSLFASTAWILFSNFTSIPAVTGHLTTRAVSTGIMNHECCDADCACSESEADVSQVDPKKRSANNKSLSLISLHPAEGTSTIPTIVADNAMQSDSHSIVTSPCHDKRSRITSVQMSHSELVVPYALSPYQSECTLDSLSTLNRSRQGSHSISIYSADLSTTSIVHTATNGPKLSGEKLHRRLQQLKSIRRVPPSDINDTESDSPPQSAKSESLAIKRIKKKRKPTKRLKSVVRLQYKNPSRVQLFLLFNFFFLYFPPWVLLTVGTYYPIYASAFLSLFRLYVNVGSCVNPVLHGFRDPRFRLMPKNWRSRIRPTTSSETSISLRNTYFSQAVRGNYF